MADKKCIHCEEKHFEDSDFCCFGCETAYKIINKFGFKNYYQIRKTSESERKIKPEIDENLEIDEFVTKKGDNFEISLIVQGLHCAACVWLIENILQKQKDVLEARINLSKKILKLSWKNNVKYGNELILLIQEIGYKLLPFDEKIIEEEEKKYNNSILLALAVAGFGAGNVMLLSFSLWFSNAIDMGRESRNLLHFFTSLISLPVIIYSGRIFFISAYKSFKVKNANMDFAISVAIFLSCLASIYQSFRQANHVYFDSAIMLIFFLLIGRYLDFRIRKKAFGVASYFTLLNASYARVEEGGEVKILPVKKLQKGMILLVSPGEKITGDGILIEGESEIDSSIITGENLPKNLKKGDQVFAGMMNLSSAIKVKILKNSSESLLSKIIEITSEAENSKGKFVNLADKLVKFYLPIVHILALLTFIFWLPKGVDISLANAIAVLLITCPCALALAIPIVQTIAVSNLIKKGILVKNGEALEKLKNCDIFVFDKTGSLTLGEMKFLDVFLLKNGKLQNLENDKKEFYKKIAASMAKNSQHPISKAISESFEGKLENILAKEIKGVGLEAEFKKKIIRLGKKEFCEITSFENSNKFYLQNLTRVFLKFGDEKLVFFLEDRVKEDAKNLVENLQKIGKKIILLSGDEENSVRYLADKLGIDEFYYAKNPVEKTQFLKEIQNDLKAKNRKFAMIGDGLNDSPSLALADISISFSKAADLSQNIADVIIQGEKLMPIFALLESAEKSLKLIKQNLAIALIYNLFAIPFAILGYVIPLVAAIAMSSSSIIVLLNSLRMNLVKNK
jgi:Cu2+-exporting ATPase